MKTALVLVALLSTAAFSIWHFRGHDVADGDTKILVDRIWIDHIPKSERETVQLFALHGEEEIGVFHAATRWRGAYEGFRYSEKGGELKIVFPQTGEKETVRTRARRCNDARGMDFCLELDGGSHGVKRYYSREGWEIRGAHTRADVEAQLDALEQTITE
jgi:hypothetical protein